MEEDWRRNSANAQPNLQPPMRRRQPPAEAAGDSQRSNWRQQASQNLGTRPDFTRTGRNDNFQSPRGRGNRGGFHQRQDQPRHVQIGRRTTFSAMLRELENEEGYMIVLKLSEKSKELENFVKEKLELSDFQLLLQILHKVCESDYDRNKAMLINQACHHDFLSSFPTKLVEGAMKDAQTFQQVASDVVMFFSTLVRMLPITAAGLKGTVQSCFNSVTGICAQGSAVTVPERVVAEFEEILKDLEALQVSVPNGGVRKWQNRRKEQVEKMKYEEPPENFRQLSIYPTIEDVVSSKEPFLRPNIVNGPYFDVEHYLDTQFRLLKEDFVRPLREGVQDLINSTNRRKCESLSVRIYRNVKFLHFVRELDDKGRVLNEGVLLCFDTNGKRYQKTNWEHTKKFLHGALLCFTSNNFQTLLFATVSGRDIKFLKECQILITFCQEHQENIYDPSKSYTMIESEVFFEPYYQVLNSLKSLDERNFPMAKYFINVQKEDIPPSYLTSDEADVDLTARFRDLNIREALFGPRERIPSNGPVRIDVQGCRGRSFPLTVLQKNTWPTAEELGLDASQYRALQAALTKELVVIQGPPGTGKTYMALKIAEILIKNKEQMRRNTPILVVCLTNHALDQFLTGMLKFTDKLVRIGGQSKCAELEEFNMKRMRVYRSRQQYELMDRLSEAYQELSNTEQRIAELTMSLQRKGFLLNPKFPEKVPQDWLISQVLMSYLRGRVYPDGSEQVYFDFQEIRSLLSHFKHSDVSEIENMRRDGKIEEQQAAYARFQNDQQYFSLEAEVSNLQILISSHVKKVKSASFKPKRAKNIYRLNVDQKLELYFDCMEEEMASLALLQKELLDTVMDKKQKLEELRYMENIAVLRDQDVIGMTTNGAARLHTMLKSLGCEIVIVEEAAEVMESHIVACVSQKCKHLILIGDHKQLRPTIAVYELGRLYNFDVSLFERMVINREGCITLQVQHRMCPEMAELIVPTIYKSLENHDSVLGRANIRSLRKRLFFKTHVQEERQDTENSSRTNEFEAAYLIAVCKHLLKQSYLPSQITMLSTYKGQMFLMKKMIKDEHSDLLRQVHVTVVDNFQGEENDIILLSLVRSNPEGRIGFLATENRVCVALSRAKLGFIIVGNMEILSAGNRVWKAVETTLEKQDAIGPALPVRCEVHTDNNFSFENIEDVGKYAPNGGCNRLCEHVLQCGHQCNHVCHLLVQDDHSKIECQAPCERKCNAGLHNCKKKCFIDCGANCMEKVLKDLPCGHSATVRCHKRPEDVFCEELVDKVFPDCEHKAINVACSIKKCTKPCDMQVQCGHSCARKCHTDLDPNHLEYNCLKACTRTKKNCRENHACQKKCHQDCDLCEEKVDRKRSCGHKFTMDCHEDPEKIECRNNCNKALSCGHFCLRKCKEDCYPCTQMVDKVVAHCGHTAKVPCGREPVREDCAQKCEKKLDKCGHICKAKCIEECTANCRETVEIEKGSCGHEIKRFCFEKIQGITADVMRCSASCGTKLQCGHQCKGTCKSCHQGRFHVPCKEKCLKELVCGHRCKSDCCLVCPPCNEELVIACEHNKMKSICGYKPHQVCKKPCNYKCKHKHCTKQCGLECNRDPCEENCEEILPCFHNCVGLCGEPCPGLCWDCDRDELLKNAFPTTSVTIKPVNPRFILLPDCNHIIEKSSLEKWFEWQSMMVEAKSCPRCKKPISALLKRYKFQYMESIADYGRIKGKIQSSAIKIEFLIEILKRAEDNIKKDYFPTMNNLIAELMSSLQTRVSAPSTFPQRGGRGRGRGKFGGKGAHQQYKLGFQITQDLPSIEKKTAVLAQLNMIVLKAVDPHKSPELVKDVEFLISMLKNTKSFSMQQIIEFKQLLSGIKKTADQCEKVRMDIDSLGFLLYGKNEIKKCELSVPLHQQKGCWKKCNNCGNLLFVPHCAPDMLDICNDCETQLIDEEPQFNSPEDEYDVKGRKKLSQRE